MMISEGEDVELELASGFLLPVSDPYKYNLLFDEDVFLEKYRNTLDEHQNKWLGYYRNRTDEMMEKAMEEGKELADEPSLREYIFNEFSDNRNNMEVYEELKRFCYWEEGEYKIELKIKTTDHDDPFSEEYKFSLDEEDADQLRTNVIGILRSIAGLEPNYHFAYPDLKKTD